MKIAIDGLVDFGQLDFDKVDRGKKVENNFFAVGKFILKLDQKAQQLKLRSTSRSFELESTGMTVAGNGESHILRGHAEVIMQKH
jgi:hypothetical protein